MVKRARVLQVVMGCISIGLIGSAIYFFWPFLSVFRYPEEVRRIITGAGAMGPLIFILMQVLQVLIAPIPGQVMGLIGGYLFGPVLGVIYTITGATIGFTMIIILTRKLGRPFVERFVNKKLLDKFDRLTREKGKLVFFLIFLLPTFPDDVISFIAGLTIIRIRDLIIISFLGRLPGYIVLNLTGNGFTYENLSPVIVFVILLLIILAIAFWKRGWIHEFVFHENRILFLKNQWKASWKSMILWITALTVLTIVLYRLAAVFPILK
ncbi:MAG: TVP38/TMEM64 family protein [Clostridia bacterium]|nr:TVP38/TMEM64 family protein [Clostridia bacterium]